MSHCHDSLIIGDSNNSCCPETNTLLTEIRDNLVAVQELDIVISNWLPICVDGKQWYVREVSLVNNDTGAITNTTKEYKDGANGVITSTAPTGTIIEGACPLPDKPNITTTILQVLDNKGKPVSPEQKVIVVTSIGSNGVPTNTYYDLVTGSIWTGNPSKNLGIMPDTDSESDYIEMCDNGITFLRWIVKENSEPTGVIFDTSLTGVVYVPTGTPTLGACALPNSIIENKSDYVEFTNVTTTPLAITLPFVDCKEINIQTISSGTTKLIVEYSTTGGLSNQKQIFFANSANYDIQLTEEKGYFTDISIYSNGGTVTAGHINFIN